MGPSESSDRHHHLQPTDDTAEAGGGEVMEGCHYVFSAEDRVPVLVAVTAQLPAAPHAVHRVHRGGLPGSSPSQAPGHRVGFRDMQVTQDSQGDPVLGLLLASWERGARLHRDAGDHRRAVSVDRLGAACFLRA